MPYPPTPLDAPPPPMRLGTAARARALQGSGDYAVAAYPASPNLVEAHDPVDQEVAIRLRTELGSLSGEVDFGNGVTHVRLWNDASPVAIHDAVRRALQDMIDRGTIANVAITVAPYARNGTAVAAYAVTYDKTGLIVSR